MGYNIGENMLADCNVKALKMLIQLRKGDCLKEMIHHSDRGSQYTSKVYLALLKKQEMRKLMEKSEEKGLTITVTKLFINDRGFAKLEIALAKGKKLYDKREDIKAKDIDRDMRRELK